jgi:trehalose 6-phosphate phosphatase
MTCRDTEPGGPVLGLPRPDAGWALFLDLDGTLIDFAPTPEAARAPPELPALLRDAEAALGGALAIVSGRAVEMIDRLLAPARLVAAGCHGAELRARHAGVAQRLAPAPSDAVRDAAASLARSAGLHLETKPCGLVLHYRTAPGLAAEARRAAAALLAEAGPDFEILPAVMAYELRPRGFDKGMALRTLMAGAPFSGRRPVFIGDDVTDRDGIAAARALGGDGVLLGHDVPGGPAEMRAWLAALPEAIGR